MANYESMRMLLGLKSPSNMTGSDPYMTRRRADIYSGTDDWVPSGNAGRYRLAQQDIQGQGIGISREDLREDDLAGVRQFLGKSGVEHGQQMEREHLRGGYGVAAQEAGQSAAMNRLLLTQEGLNRRSEQTLNLRKLLGLLTAEQQAARTTQTGEDRLELEQFRQGEMNKRAEASRPSGLMSWLSGLLSDNAVNAEEDPDEETVVEPAPQAAPRRRILSVR